MDESQGRGTTAPVSPADRALAECFAGSQPFEIEAPRFRVSADWAGGGFAYTMPFPSREAALAWGERKASAHRDAVVAVCERPTFRAIHEAAQAECRAILRGVAK